MSSRIPYSSGTSTPSCSGRSATARRCQDWARLGSDVIPVAPGNWQSSKCRVLFLVLQLARSLRQDCDSCDCLRFGPCVMLAQRNSGRANCAPDARKTPPDPRLQCCQACQAPSADRRVQGEPARSCVLGCVVKQKECTPQT